MYGLEGLDLKGLVRRSCTAPILDRYRDTYWVEKSVFIYKDFELDIIVWN